MSTVAMVDADPEARWWRRLVRARVGPLLGLLFLIGPLSDLADESASAARVAAICVALAAFVAIYLALLPPVRPLARRGPRACELALALLAVLAGLTLALGAPGSFASLYVYVVAVAGILLPPRAAAVAIVGAAVAVGGGLAVTGSDSSTVAAYVLTILAVGATMAALGSSTRANRRLREAQGQLARLAVAEERLRISRDLHDLLGHNLSVIALKSELAAKLAETDPQRARAELADVQRVTRQALTEVRDAVQGYRRLAFADALDGASAALSAAGIDCRIESSAADLPAEVDDLLAWTVREAATNVVRHSDADACAITVSTEPESVTLQIEDDGRALPGDGEAGSGLRGLEERARRLDGTLEAGARPEGGFRLRLTVPLAS
jgi:two-component system sensor histidine kinase DesK